MMIAIHLQSCAIFAQTEQSIGLLDQANSIDEQEISQLEQTQRPNDSVTEKSKLLNLLQPQQSVVAPAGPDVFMLPDKDGKLRMVLGFSYEDFLRSWQLENEITKPPKYNFLSQKIQGKIEEQLAKLEFDLIVQTSAEGWVEIPLKMPKLIIQEYLIESQHEGECVIFDPQRKSYLLWLKGKKTSSRKLSLTGILPLEVNGETSRLSLSTPRIPLTDLLILAPIEASLLQLPPGMELKSLSRDGAGTLFELNGSTSPLVLEWEQKKETPSQTNRIIETVGNQKIRIGRHVIRYEAELSVKRYGAPLDRLQVLLPSRSKLVQEAENSDFRIKILKEESIDGRQLVEIISKKSNETNLKVELAAEQLIEEENNSKRTLEGFEVLNSFRQSGFIELQLKSPLQAYFDLWGKIDQVPLKEQPEIIVNTKTIGRFEYAGFPWRIIAHVIPGQRRISVEPKYQITIDAEEARLELDLEYLFSGARTYFLRIDMHGWELTDDPIESTGAVNQDLYTITQSDLLNLPLQNPDISAANIKFIAKKKVKTGANTFQLPEPLNVFVSGGSLIVDSDPALQILPRLDESTGIRRVYSAEKTRNSQYSAQSGDGETSLPYNERDQLAFRTFQASPILEYDIDLREQESSCELKTNIKIDNSSCKVSQQLQYEVKYQPTSQLMIYVPKTLWENNSFHLEFEGEKIPYGLVLSDSEKSKPVNEELDSKRIILALPRPLLGKFEINAIYNLEVPELTNKESQLDIPFVLPSNDLGVHKVEIHHKEGFEVNLDRNLLDNSSIQNPKAQNYLQTVNLAEPKDAISLILKRKKVEDIPKTTTERIWLQSWLIGNQLQTRGVYRCRNLSGTINFDLPSFQSDQSVEVLLDGVPVGYKKSGENILAVQIPEDKQNHSLTLELRYLQTISLLGWGRLNLTFPVLESATTDCPVYWQIILPSERHAISEPKNFSAEYWLGWKNNRWGRHPHYTQNDLEQITAATSQPEPSEVMNQYVYHSFRQSEQLEVQIISRFWLLLISSSLVFTVGLLGIYTSLLTRKEFWLVVAIAIFVIYFVYPEVARLAVQAVFWGGSTVLLAAILKRQFLDNHRNWILSPEQFAASTAITQSWKKPQEDADNLEENTASLPLS